MAGFISESACRGSRPKNVDLINKKLREDLISKLLSQRSVMRYISAPDGFGKTTLAAQYAELIFSFKDVFWINCSSPCFIRDLDSKQIFNQIVQMCEVAKLVVFDNYTELGEDRDLLFSNVVNNLLEIGAEVIVLSCPISDNLLKFQHDAFILSTNDLLLDNKEAGGNFVSDISRIPIIAYNAYGLEKLLKCAVDENFINSLIFGLFYIYLAIDGKVTDLEQFLSKSDISLLTELNKKYLYFGVENKNKEFHVPSIDLTRLMNSFSAVYETLYSFIGCKNKLEFIKKLYSSLNSTIENSRLVELASLCADHKLHTEVLQKYNENSICDAYIDKAIALFNKAKFNDKEMMSNLPYQAIRLAIYGKTQMAIKYSYSILDSQTATNEEKLLATFVFLRFGSSIERDKALKIARYLYTDFNIDTYLNKKSVPKERVFVCIFLKKVIDIYFAVLNNTKNPFRAWLNNCNNKISDIDLVCAECILNSIPLIKKAYINDSSFNEFISSLNKYFLPGTLNDFNFYKYAVLKAYLKIHSNLEQIKGVSLWKPDSLIMKQFEQLDKKIEYQKEKYFSYDTERKDEYLNDIHSFEGLRHNKSNDILESCESYENIPKLRVRIFGGLSVAIGNREIINTDFGRQNIKLIVCILAMQNGHEISKNKLAKILWPNVNSYAQRININAAWSVLRKIFTLPNGQCPYLIRSQTSYKFLSKYVECDITQFNDFCAELSLGSLDAYSWYLSIKNNEEIIDGDLLPGETKNRYICNKRIEYRNKIVDSLIFAANRLLEADQPRQALWFANKAYQRDNNREDVYSTLMKIQLRCGQRTPAIETYLACEKFLKSSLGIKPCSEIKDLYQRALNTTK